MNADEIPFDPRERPPEHLYKYRSLNGPSFEFTRKIVEDASVWFSKPLDFNDPFDCAPVVTAECSEAEYQQHIKQLVQSQTRGEPRAARRAKLTQIKRKIGKNDRPTYLKSAYNRVIPEVVNRAGVLSLSDKCDDVLMWSHYADSHQGCCLRFKATGDIFLHARRVHYSKERPLLNVIRDRDGQILLRALLVKADFWAYEQEWRVIDRHGPGAYRYEPASLDGIIIGARVSAEARDAVLKWAEAHKPPVQIMQATFDPAHFRLVIT